MPSDAKVYEVGVALFVNDDVFWFEIAVDDVAAVEGLEGVEEAANDEFLILRNSITLFFFLLSFNFGHYFC